MTDFHAHFLPGIDDGMLEMWRDQGISRICATPHFYAEHSTPESFLRRRNTAYESLLEAAGDGSDLPAILLGAEVRFFDGMCNTRELPMLCFEGTNLLLLEMPFTRWTDRMLREVEEIARRGIIPVAAHIERYMDLNSRKVIRSFMESGILVQCNAEFFLTHRTSRRALTLLRDGYIHFLGSDAHNAASRAPNIGDALDLIEKKLGPSSIEHLISMEEMIDEEREGIPV